VLGGTVSSFGSHYLIDLGAVACNSGDTLAKEQAEAASKEEVLKALSKASSSLRIKLGESLPSVQKFEVPVEATTASLEALKNYSMAITATCERGSASSIPFFKRAIELDPNFATGYSGLAIAYGNLNQRMLALENAAKAYALRERVSEREKLRIAATYFSTTGEMEKETQTYELWTVNYPRDFVPQGNLGTCYANLGQHEKSLRESQEALRLAPSVTDYTNIGLEYINLNQLDRAKATLDEALAHNLWSRRAWRNPPLGGKSPAPCSSVRSTLRCPIASTAARPHPRAFRNPRQVAVPSGRISPQKGEKVDDRGAGREVDSSACPGSCGRWGAKAKAAYQEFFTIWKDADPDIPILIAAKVEYAKL